MKAFGWWIVLVVAEFAVFMVLALTADAWGYPVQAAAFVRMAVALGIVLLVSSLVLAAAVVWTLWKAARRP